jgi:hypothetical protein
VTRLDHLPDIAARGLGGLNADARLLGQIRLAAAGSAAKRRVRWQPVLLYCAAVAVFVAAALWGAPLLRLRNLPGTQPSIEVLGSSAAGGDPQAGDEYWAVAQGGAAGNVQAGGGAADAGSFRNLFAPERGGNFPLLMVDGAAYRMLISPTNMKNSLLGVSLGEVSEYTLEPALSTGGGIVSNIVNAGETVYAVKGMQGAMAAGYVKGGLRVFQRVSFAGTALLGSETLADTLTGASAVTAMELTGVGIVDDATTARALMQTLLDNATYGSASVGGGETRSLLIALANGLLMQLMVGDDTVSACGTWSCPEFFEAYALAVAE